MSLGIDFRRGFYRGQMGGSVAGWLDGWMEEGFLEFVPNGNSVSQDLASSDKAWSKQKEAL